jgi:hypothetical protein
MINKLKNNVISVWSSVLSIFYLCNIDQFAFAAGMGPAPKFWLIFLFLATLFFLIISKDILTPKRMYIIYWVFGYLFLSVFWIAGAGFQEGSIEGLMKVISTCLFVGMAVIIYSKLNSNNKLFVFSLLVSLCIGVISVILDFFYSPAFIFSDAGVGIRGRAAGLYLNPNIAAQAIIMMYACLLTFSSRSILVPISMISMVSLIGVILTLSRGGLLAWIALTIFASLRGLLPKWYLMIIFILALCVIFLNEIFFNTFGDLIPDWDKNVQMRMEWIFGRANLVGESAGDRMGAAAQAWSIYWENPLLGHGLGSMDQLMGDVGTHNMILRHMLEYGILGVLIFPLFIIMCIVATGSIKNMYWLLLVGTVIFLLGLFSHNLLEQGSLILPWLAICIIKFRVDGYLNR